jgi:hypothetical protein
MNQCTEEVHVLWRCDDPQSDEIPAKQTLERLVCASLRQAYPDRAVAVRSWLAARPDPPPPTPKEHSWSYMAGWYGEHGCDDFFQAIWRDPTTRAALLMRLSQSGACALMRAMTAR